jgi:hypothetical protein
MQEHPEEPRENPSARLTFSPGGKGPSPRFDRNSFPGQFSVASLRFGAGPGAVRVIVLDALGLSGPGFVQVTICSSDEQVQSVTVSNESGRNTSNQAVCDPTVVRPQ